MVIGRSDCTERAVRLIDGSEFDVGNAGRRCDDARDSGDISSGDEDEYATASSLFEVECVVIAADGIGVGNDAMGARLDVGDIADIERNTVRPSDVALIASDAAALLLLLLDSDGVQAPQSAVLLSISLVISNSTPPLQRNQHHRHHHHH
jgi:hypothetical protein